MFSAVVFKRIGLLSIFLHKRYIHSYSFTYRVLLINSGIFVYLFPCCLLKIAIIIFRSIFFMLDLCQFWFSKLLIERYFSCNKVVHGGSTRPTNGTRSEKVYKFTLWFH